MVELYPVPSSAVPGMAQLRQRGLQMARQHLADKLEEERETETALLRIEMETWRRRDAASALSEDDNAVEEFARWLPQARVLRAAAQAKLDRANADAVCARAILVHAEAAARLIPE